MADKHGEGETNLLVHVGDGNEIEDNTAESHDDENSQKNKAHTHVQSFGPSAGPKGPTDGQRGPPTGQQVPAGATGPTDGQRGPPTGLQGPAGAKAVEGMHKEIRREIIRASQAQHIHEQTMYTKDTNDVNQSRQKDQQNHLFNITNEKDKCQLASTTSMAVIHVGILKALLDLGPQGVHYYYISLGLVIFALVLHFIGGLIAVYLATMKDFQQKRLSYPECCRCWDDKKPPASSITNAKARYSKYGTCRIEMSANTLLMDEEDLENNTDTGCCLCCRKQIKSDLRNVSTQYKAWQEEVWIRELEAAEVRQRIYWVEHDIYDLKKKYNEFDHIAPPNEQIQKQAVMKQIEEKENEKQDLMKKHRNWELFLQRGKMLEGYKKDDKRCNLTNVSSQYKAWQEEVWNRQLEAAEVEQRIFWVAKDICDLEQRKDDESINDNIQNQIADKIEEKVKEEEELKEKQRNWELFLLQGKILEGHASITCTDDVLKRGAYWQNILNFVIYSVLVLNTLITGFGLATIGTKQSP